MNAILAALAADPNVAPAFAQAVRPFGFGDYNNFVISNRLGQPCSLAHARSAEDALRPWPEGYTARVQRYECPDDNALGRRTAAAWGGSD